MKPLQLQLKNNKNSERKSNEIRTINSLTINLRYQIFFIKYFY